MTARIRYWIVLLSVVLLTTGQIFAQSTFWQATGLTSGNVNQIAINQSGQIFAGTTAGVYRSTDQGSSWARVDAGFAYTETNALSISSTTGYVYVGTFPNGIYRSTNNGASWSLLSTPFTSYVRSFAINASGWIFAATNSDKVYSSTDNGSTWIQASNGIPNQVMTPLAINTSGHLFVGTRSFPATGDGRVYRSTNSGGNWDLVLPPTGSVYSLVTLSGSTLFAGTEEGTGIWRSTDNGGNWVQRNNGLTFNRTYALAANSDGHVFAGTVGGGVYRSFDNGDTWVQLNTGLTNSNVPSLAISIDGYIYAGTQGGGVFRSVQSTTGVSRDGLVSYYPFSGNANDESGNGNTITNNGAVLTTDRFGIPNRAYSFNGTSAYMLINDADLSLSFDARTASYTASVWAFFPSIPNRHIHLIQDRLNSGPMAYYLNLDGINGRKMTASIFDGTSFTSLLSNLAITQNQWYLFTMVVNGGQIRLYINGDLDATVTIPSGISSTRRTSVSSSIGAFWNTPSSPVDLMQGKLDDIRIYNRALTGVEIQDLYIQGPIVVASPNGGEIWQVGSTQNITWTSSGVANVKIERRLNDASDWKTIVASTPASTNCYPWTVRDSPSDQCRIRISSVENPTVTATSGAFRIISGEKWVAGYLPGRRQDEGFDAGLIDFSLVTHVIHHGIVPTPDGYIDLTTNSVGDANAQALVQAAHGATPRRNVLISVSGTDNVFLSATSEANRAAFIGRLVNRCSLLHYDGISIDWESVPQTSESQFRTFLSELRTAMAARNPALLLTAASGPDDYWGAFFWGQAYLDQIYLMLYDQSGPGWGETWHNAALYRPSGVHSYGSGQERVVDFLLRGIDRSKIGFGIPFYGCVWKGGQTSNGGVTWHQQTFAPQPASQPTMRESTYADIMDHIWPIAAHEFDEVAQVPFLSIDAVLPADDRFVSYDDASSVQQKVQYADQMGLGGIMIWELTQEYRPTDPRPLSGAIKRALMGEHLPPSAAVTLPIFAPGSLVFSSGSVQTFTSIGFSTFTGGPGLVTAERYSEPPASPAFPTSAPLFVSPFSWNISQRNLGSLTGTVNFELPANLRAMTNLEHATIYRRQVFGNGMFFPLVTQYDSTTNAVSAQVHGFGEFILGSDSIGIDPIRASRKYAVNDAWNLLSVPLKLSDLRRSAAYPSSISAAFAFTLSGGYAARESLAVGVGYWLKFSTPDSLTLNGIEFVKETVDVSTGWNIIGSLSNETMVAYLQSMPESLIASSLYGYRNGYYASDTVEPGKGYWVKCRTNGSIVLSVDPTSGGRPLFRRAENLCRKSVLSVEDGKGEKRILYWSSADLSAEEYELPPPPPAGVCDVRFSTNRMLVTVGEGNSRTVPIRVAYAEYPLRISWETSDQAVSASLIAGNRQVQMNGSGSVAVTDPQARLALKLDGQASLPKVFDLQQNYPNPFNPSTIIKYDLPKDSRVTLKIYDVLGREVATLVNGEERAGFKSAVWNATGFASGVYFYRLQAGDYTATRKLLLLK
jgi:GH18 family chitinase/photosystem II stability/assembly factor-like uncharacterized protein